MEDSWNLPLYFSHHVYPTIGFPADQFEYFKTDPAKQTAQAIIQYFQTPSVIDKIEQQQKLWNPIKPYWNLTSYTFKSLHSSSKPEKIESDLILDKAWLDKLSITPATIIAFYELEDSIEQIVSQIKELEELTSLICIHIIIPTISLEPSKYQSYSNRIIKESSLDYSKLIIYPTRDHENLSSFIPLLEKSISNASINYYSKKISKRQHKITLQKTLLNNDSHILLENEPHEVVEKKIEQVSSKSMWYFYGRGKLIRHYIKQSYYAECSGETELKKWCIKEAYQQIQIYSKEVVDFLISQSDITIDSFDSYFKKILYENLHWNESLHIMNNLCTRMEREAIKELQESPRVQHLQNLLQILDIPKYVGNYYKYFILAQSLELLLPIYDLAFNVGSELTKSPVPKAFDQKLIECLPIEIPHIGILKYYIANIFIQCIKAMDQEGLKSLTSIIDSVPVTISATDISKRTVHHLVESKNSFTNKMWLVNIDTLIAKCFYMTGDYELGLKKMISASNIYRDQRWKKMLYETLKVMMRHCPNENKLLCLLEMSTIERSINSVKAWMDFLDLEQLDVVVDSTSTTPIINCQVKFAVAGLVNENSAAFNICLTSSLPVPITIASINVKLDPPSSGDLTMNDILVGPKPVHLVGIANMPPNTLSVNISQAKTTIRGKKGSITYIWNIPSENPKTIWRYCSLDKTLDFEFSNIQKFEPAFSNEVFSLELKIINNSLVNVDRVQFELSFLDEFLHDNLYTSKIEVGTILPKSSKIITHKLTIPSVFSVHKYMFEGILLGEIIGLQPLLVRKASPISVINPLKVLCKSNKSATEAEITNASIFPLKVTLPNLNSFILEKNKNCIYSMQGKPDSLAIICNRLTPNRQVILDDFSISYNLLYDKPPNIVTVDLICDPVFIQGKPSQLKYLIKNPTNNSVKLLLKMSSTEGIVFSGHKSLTFRLLPKKTYTLIYTVVFLSCQNLLPKFTLSIISDFLPNLDLYNYPAPGPDTIRVPSEPHTILNNIIRNDKISVIVIPK
ncbi:hypothetical protein BB561_001513 [Smittium simulii]|uniref:Trafficking protein particle complex subunit 11 domain-containing protein n=1 Tax=Smittium simulii TaxID=133385 RepID=A0A2T9YUB4_9FUNG|nr:hypothetical protein BB561_001513 [Smittium simulii]